MSSDLPESPNAGRLDPREIASPQEVYEVFRDLIENPRRKTSSRANPYYSKGDQSLASIPVSESHQRLTSFTKEQERYIDLCRASLRDSVVSTEEGLLARFRGEWGEGRPPEDFENVLTDTYLACMNEAFDRHPNLLPAYYAFLVSTGAGADGLELAVLEGLHPRRIGEGGMKDNVEHFMAVHDESSGNVDTGETYEVQCAAPVLAMKIISEVGKCVEEAGFKVNDDNLTSFHTPTAKISNEIRGALTEKMNQIGYTVPSEH